MTTQLQDYNQQLLPPLDSEYPLSAEQVEAFQRDGYIVLRQVLTPEEIAAYRPIILDAVHHALVLEGRAEAKPMEERDTLGKAFLQVLHLWERYEPMRAFSLSKRLGGIAAKLLRTSAVRFYHDQVLFKEPGGGHTPWHQDGYYIPLDPDRVLTMWMPLVEVTPEMGTMSYAAGSHREGPLFALPTSDESETRYDQLVAERGWDVRATGAMQPGDVAIHSLWTLHHAGPNATDRTREAAVMLYYPDGTRLRNVDSIMVEGASRYHLGGIQPGELANSEINPIVYSE